MEGVRIPLLPVGIGLHISPFAPGGRTQTARIVSEKWESNRAVLVFEGIAGTRTSFEIVRRRYLPLLRFQSPENKSMDPNETEHNAEYVTMIDDGRDLKFPMGLFLNFPPGEGWKTITVTLTW